MPPQPSGNSGPGYAIPGGPPPPASSPPSGPPHSSGSRAKWWLAAGAAAVVVVIAVTVGILRWGAKDSGSQDNAAAAGSAVSTVQPVPLISGIEPIGRLDAQGNLESSFGAGPYPAETTSATCTPQTIAIAGPLSGPNAPLGRNVLGGLRLAVDQFTKRNPDCSITVREFDTLGQPQTSAQVIPQIVNDPSVIALIGPVFSGETKANGKVLSDAGLPFLTPSATNATLSQQGWRTFFRGLASDDIQGPALGRYLAGSVGVTRACVISDDTEYGVGIAAAMTTELGTAALPSCSGTIPLGKDASDMVGKIAAAAPDAVYYGGYYSESAPILKQLRKAGVFAQFYSGDGSFDPEFVSGAGSDGSGTTLTCACGPAASGFDTDYRSLIGSAPGVYSVEAYDLATIVLGGIASGKTSRADLLAYLKGFDGVGLAGYYRWADNGEPAEPRVWLYQVS
ncbi:branched-chain amino acid ABC transporter substrate-binding protein [Nocardia huaxiensis]|uniref:Branched-chain amino acid ABC transporter substrate-binding protein n=2 Tax=Nocardia huaxiensis TaxID=2755382 RepID=A0A7D6VEA2_9NOCA|nr:branched-chain amino acid ABC transporter substrate-binding protein [Nocardia huaxiensis]